MEKEQFNMAKFNSVQVKLETIGVGWRVVQGTLFYSSSVDIKVFRAC